jgi:hypothetical protein
MVLPDKSAGFTGLAAIAAEHKPSTATAAAMFAKKYRFIVELHWSAPIHPTAAGWGSSFSSAAVTPL